MSMSIDKDEMRAVLLTFSIELTEAQIDQIMADFGARDQGDGLGKTIRYPGDLPLFRPESPKMQFLLLRVCRRVCTCQ